MGGRGRHHEHFRDLHRLGMLNTVESTRLTRPQPNGHASAKDVLEDALGLRAVPREPEEVGLQNILRGGLELTTQTKGGSPAVIRIPHSILAVLVTVALAMIGGGFWLVSSITEMKTNLAVIQENQREIKAEQSSNLKLMTAYATNETNRINFLTGLLTNEQRQQVYQYDSAHPRPSLPEPKDSDERNR